MVEKVGYGSSLHFEVLGDLIIGEKNGLHKWDHYKAHFGVMPGVVSIVWKMLASRQDTPKLKPKHLMWALLWLKVYPSERVIETLLNADRGSIRSWVPFTIKAIASLKKQVVSASEFEF